MSIFDPAGKNVKRTAALRAHIRRQVVATQNKKTIDDREAQRQRELARADVEASTDQEEFERWID